MLLLFTQVFFAVDVVASAAAAGVVYEGVPLKVVVVEDVVPYTARIVVILDALVVVVVAVNAVLKTLPFVSYCCCHCISKCCRNLFVLLLSVFLLPLD